VGKASPTQAGMQAAREVLEKSPSLVRNSNRVAALHSLAQLYDSAGPKRFALIVGLRPPANPIEAAFVDRHFRRITPEQFKKLFEAEAMRPVDTRMLDAFFTALDKRIVAYNGTIGEVLRQGHAIATGSRSQWDFDAFGSHKWKKPLPLTSNEVQTVAAFLEEVRIEKNLGFAKLSGFSEPCAASLVFRVFDTLKGLFRFVTKNTIDYGSLPDVYRWLQQCRLPFGVDLQNALAQERAAASVVLRDRTKPTPGFPESITVGSLTIQTARCEVTADSAHVHASSVTTEADPVAERNVFRQEGDLWIAQYASHRTHVKHAVGLAYIAHLIACQGKSVDAVVLRAAVSGHAATEWQSGMELTDEQAIGECRTEYEDLEEQLEEARGFNDEARQEDLERQKAQLADYILKPRGLGKKLRTFRGDAERARSAVTQAIARAIKKLADQHEELARHFERSIQTGHSLSYSPSTEVSWEL
jgi:hypothetical protein